MNIRFALYDNDASYLPVRAHEDDACYDLFARAYCLPGSLASEQDVIILAPEHRCLVKTGLFLEMEPGWEALVRPRSGNALKHGITILNTPGTIDAGYRNEIGVIIHNAGQVMLELKQGMKIAQIAFRPIPKHALERIDMAVFNAETERGLGGFGSSGS